MRQIVLAIFLLNCPGLTQAQPAKVLHLSHDATILVVSQQGNSSGTAFMVGERLALTCLHVVAHTAISAQGQVSGNVFQDVKVTMPSGEVIAADVVSVPSSSYFTPLIRDFAFLKLRTKPASPVSQLQFASDDYINKIDIGDDVVFSGFPLATPGMITHKGMVSGMLPDRSLIFIQSSINKGNSGGALLNSEGKIIGIVSLREGGITQELANLRQRIYSTEKEGSVTYMGVNPLSSIKMLIDTVDQYISVGIGYAHSAQFPREYLNRHPELLK